MKRLWVLGFVLFIFVVDGKLVIANSAQEERNGGTEEITDEEQPINDPIAPFNKTMFVFNDAMFYWLIKPVYIKYNCIVPARVRKSIRDVFTNLKMPVRFSNCLFQSNLKGAGMELLRFAVNSTAGGGGFWDPATKLLHIKEEDRDFGQTLGGYGMGPGAYIVLPFIGPSNTRDVSGLVMDTILNPLSWVSLFFLTPVEGVGNYAYQGVNELSLDAGEGYEKITKKAIDPYIALQDAYTEYREKKMKE